VEVDQYLEFAINLKVAKALGSRFPGRCCIRRIGSSGRPTVGDGPVTDTARNDQTMRVEVEEGGAMRASAFRAALVLTAVTLAVLLALPGGAAAVQVGEQAPDFKLPATTGGEIRLSDFRGKQMVLIEFYHADFGPT